MLSHFGFEIFYLILIKTLGAPPTLFVMFITSSVLHHTYSLYHCVAVSELQFETGKVFCAFIPTLFSCHCEPLFPFRHCEPTEGRRGNHILYCPHSLSLYSFTYAHIFVFVFFSYTYTCFSFFVIARLAESKSWQSHSLLPTLFFITFNVKILWVELDETAASLRSSQ